MFEHANLVTPHEVKVINGPSGRFYISPTTNERYPSITTVLGAKEKPQLAAWKLAVGDKKAAAVAKEAADRGSAVHDMLEKFLKNDPAPTAGYDPVLTREFNQLRLLLKKISLIYAQEIALYSDTLKVAGRVDCIAVYNGTLAVIDFKTSKNNKTSTMIDSYYKQAAFYALAFEEMYGIQIDNIVILMSVENGIVPLVFKQKVEDWIEPLVHDVQEYHKTHRRSR